MIIGLAISLLLFGGLGYLLTSLGLNQGLEKDNRFLAVLFYFLAPVLGFTILSFVIMAGMSMFGVSMSVAAEACLQAFGINSAGVAAVIGSTLSAVYAIIGMSIGPGCAFIGGKISSIVAAIILMVNPDREFSKRWLPVIGGAVYAFAMWPFASVLTFGL